MLRARALAKVNRIAATTHDYVAPRLGSAAHSASSRLQTWRDSSSSSSVSSPQDEPAQLTYQVRQPKRAAAASAAAGTAGWSAPALEHGDLHQRYAGSARSLATSATSSATEASAPSRKWTASGLGSYLHLSSYGTSAATATAPDPDSATATSSANSTATGSRSKPAVGADDVDEDKILCFPGVRLSGPLSSSLPTPR